MFSESGISWVPGDLGSQAKGEIGFDSTPAGRIEQKRGHQLCMDSSQPEHLGNKKLATEAVKNKPALNSPYGNDYPWHNHSNFQLLSGQARGHLFGSERVHNSEVVQRSHPSAGSGSMIMGTKENGGEHVSGPYMGLSITHNVEDHSGSIELGGQRKVRVNQVTDSNKDFYTLIKHSYSGSNNSSISVHTTLNRSDCGSSISLGPTYNKSDVNTMPIGSICCKADGNFISMGHNLNQGDGYFMPMACDYKKESENFLSLEQPVTNSKDSFIPMGLAYAKQDNSLMTMPSRASIGLNYANQNVDFMSTIHPSWKRDDNLISMTPSFGKLDFTINSAVPTPDKGDSGILSLGHNYGENANNGNTISFGAFCGTKINASGASIGGYGLSFPGCSSGRGLAEVESQKNLLQSNPDAVADNSPNADMITNSAQKSKQPKIKKDASNNFPSNVKSLMSTGILDDIPVKYVSWSREKSLKGIIKGTGYLCGCNECNYSKNINAFEFERHANCKTKHPNNHIYFNNGKTIYAVVQELKNTPQEKLFDAVQSVTGSQINEKNFLSWKASFEVASRELQRIYGMDQVGGQS